MRAVRRVFLEVLGWALVIGGVAALVLPGPGLLALFAGLVLLSQQYAWAERRVEPVKERAVRAAADGVQTWPRILLSALGVIWLIGAGIVWGIRPPAPGWWPVAERWWLMGGWAAGVTLIASGIIAGGMIGYAFRVYRKPS
ncbi:MAG TPA: PGPGW domain-containing protein [Nocardioides sp.]|nr:PGPGW domain-containing protein [Nocardioides sp.]